MAGAQARVPDLPGYNPLAGACVKLQANGPQAVARRRTVHDTRTRAEISLEGAQVQSVVGLPGRPGKDANAVAADVIGNAKVRGESRIDAA